MPIGIQGEVPKEEWVGDVMEQTRHRMHIAKGTSWEIPEDLEPKFDREVERLHFFE
jgi:hypothetical protein